MNKNAMTGKQGEKERRTIFKKLIYIYLFTFKIN